MQAGHRRPYVDGESPANIGIGNEAGAGTVTPITLRLQQKSAACQSTNPGDADIEHRARSI
jgi:hypothetical protein